MGNSKSQQFNTLLSKYKSQEWIIQQQKQAFQIWQRKTDNKCFMAYPINEAQIDSQQKLQLYNFRKLNHGNLVAIDSILSNQDQYLCSFPKNQYVLVENIPYRLASYKHTFNLFDGLTILSATFAGYNTLNYVYGPLFTNEQMIGFTETGIPKVWVNQNFSINDPSNSAMNGGDQVLSTNNEQRTYCCVQKIFDIVQISINGGYPLEFKTEAAQITTFSQGEELVQNYCRRRGINLDDKINLHKNIQVEPLQFRSESYLRSSRPSLNTYIRTNPFIQGSKPEISTNYIMTQVSSQHPTINIPSQQTPSQSIVLNKPYARVSINSSKKINFVFNGQNIQDINNITLPQQKLNKAKLPEISNDHQFKQNVPIVTKEQIPTLAVPSQPTKINFNQQVQFTNEQSNFSHLDRVCNSLHQRPHISTVQSKQQILIHTPKVIQQSQDENEQQYQLMVHEIVENDQEEINNQQVPQILVENNRLPTSESVQEQGLIQSHQDTSQPIDQLKKWEESLMKLSQRQKQNYEQKLVTKNKPFYSSEEQQYLSQERDKVNIQPNNPIQQFTNLNELQSYIRNKYKEYLTSPSQQNYSIPTRNIPPIQTDYQYDSNQYFNYTEDYNPPVCQPLPLKQNQQNDLYSKYKISQEDSDQRKYTFGKIELDPISANNQYNKAQQRQRRPSAFQPSKLKDVKRYNENSLQDKYSKYVKNREPRTNILQSKDISSIMRVQDSVFNTNKKDYLFNQYLQESYKEIQKPKQKQQKDNSLTYDKLRELLWA